jgi:P27 family predicted phage terminase small subunit
VGQRGPKPKNPALKLLAGNPGKRPVGAVTSAGTARPGRPDRPRELKGEAAREWERIVPELEAAGWLAVIDRAGLAAYCCAWAQFAWAEGVIQREGAIVSEPVQTAKGEVVGSRMKAHPAVKMRHDAAAQMGAFLDRFGLTPAARSRLTGGGGPPAPTEGNKVLSIRDRIQQARNAGPA